MTGATKRQWLGSNDLQTDPRPLRGQWATTRAISSRRRGQCAGGTFNDRHPPRPTKTARSPHATMRGSTRRVPLGGGAASATQGRRAGGAGGGRGALLDLRTSLLRGDMPRMTRRTRRRRGQGRWRDSQGRRARPNDVRKARTRPQSLEHSPRLVFKGIVGGHGSIFR